MTDMIQELIKLGLTLYNEGQKEKSAAIAQFVVIEITKETLFKGKEKNP